MPVKSYGFANGAVHVLESRLSSPDRIERLLSAADGMDAVKILQEAGYGRGEEVSGVADYEGWLEKRVAEAYAFVGSVSPEPNATDCFLLRIDYTNLKILYKARHLMIDSTEMLREGGLLSIERLSESVREQDYKRLTEPMMAALVSLDQKAVSGKADSRAIDAALDRAMFRDIKERVSKAKSAAVKTYFKDFADLVNLRSALRARAMGMSKEELREQLVVGGEVELPAIELALEEPERALRAFTGRPFKRKLDDAVALFGQSGALGRFEVMVDNHLLELIKRGQWSMDSIEPLVGYLLGVEREAAAVRLCMVGLINGFPAEAVRERLGDLYA